MKIFKYLLAEKYSRVINETLKLQVKNIFVDFHLFFLSNSSDTRKINEIPKVGVNDTDDYR